MTADIVKLRLGVEVPWDGYGFAWEKFFTDCELRDFLDVVTVIFQAIPARWGQLPDSWREGVATIFQEENIGYRLDSHAGVHFLIDGEFERNQQGTISALQTPRYGAALAHFEAAQRSLDAVPPETRTAIRETFECAETVFKLMFPGEAVLGSSGAGKRIQALIASMLAGTEKDSANRLLDAFKAWIVSAQPYRHGQAVEKPDNPSVHTTVLNVSLGASFVRWLAELDQSRLAHMQAGDGETGGGLA